MYGCACYVLTDVYTQVHMCVKPEPACPLLASTALVFN